MAREQESKASKSLRPAKKAVPKSKPFHELETTETPAGENPGHELPVIGIGASAGGLEALGDFFRAMPADSGFAFVVITHQHPGHTSLLPDLLGKCTKMRVVEAKDGTRMEPNSVYTSPPGSYLAIMRHVIHQMPPPQQMPPLPIDFFFRSLAEDAKERAVCIILSGTGADGTLGLRAVKGEGGLAMVQEVQSARYAGMPSSAIGTALADFILPPAAMPGQLVAYSKGIAEYRRRVDATELPPDIAEPLQKIFILLRSHTGHDFSGYKTNTLRRRIERRMVVHQIMRPADYVRYLHEHPHEIEILFKELLISVTNFFRDREAFDALSEKILPPLLTSRPDNYVFRAWLPGCCSGEEAYSIAITLRECIDNLKKPMDVQIFGTDLDADAIEIARSGKYPSGIAVDIAPARLERNFRFEHGIYRIASDIREWLVFAPQNVIRDPPFTNLDLLCCRNLLIYLNADLQKRLMRVFHYALKPGGLLMLGPSETIGSLTDLFDTVDKKWKIYRRKESHAASLPPEMPGRAPHGGVRDGAHPGVLPSGKQAQPSSLIEKMLLARYTPPTVLCSARGDIVYIQGRTGDYLEPASGHPSQNIIEMAREGLKIDLSSALRQASDKDTEIVRNRVRVKANDEYSLVDLSVTRIREPESLRGLLLVTFKKAEPAPAPSPSASKKKSSREDSSDKRVKELESDLHFARASLQTTVEELETANEELKSTNEELQSTNEELQSTNEEMETSKEEMQSLNEELTTVNSELQSKVDELSNTSNDMQNLLNGTDVATIFLDNKLLIKRYTERAKAVVNLIPSDVGRPIGDLVSNLAPGTDLAESARIVLSNLVPKEAEVLTKDGAWYLMRIMPYRTTENTIQGLVITFVEITRIKNAENAVQAAEKTGRDSRAYFDSIFDTLNEPMLVLDHEMHVVSANSAFFKLFATNTKHTQGDLFYELGGGEWNIPDLRRRLEHTLATGEFLAGFEVSAVFPRIGKRRFVVNATRLERETGFPPMLLLEIKT